MRKNEIIKTVNKTISETQQKMKEAQYENEINQAISIVNNKCRGEQN